MDDFTLAVRQIGQYPPKEFPEPADVLVLQEHGLGGPYRSVTAPQLVGNSLSQGGWLLIQTGFGITWTDRATFRFDGSAFVFDNLVNVPELNATEGGLFDHGDRVATFKHFEWLAANQVLSVNNRTGHVQIEEADILRAGGAPVWNPHFSGWCTATTPWDPRSSDDTIATTAWVQAQWCNRFNDTVLAGGIVTSFDGRGGDILLGADDITFAGTQPGAQPRANTPPAGDASNRIATTLFVDDGLAELKFYVDSELDAWTTQIVNSALADYAPLASPQFTGIPTAPTANPGSSTGQLATTAFVHAAVVAATAGVASFNTRTGAVVLIGADITAAGGALLVSPAFAGAPTTPTAPPGTNTTQIATTAFVNTAVAAVTAGGVLSFNTRTGAVSLTLGDVTGTGVLANTALTGAPTAPTATAGTSTTQLATTAFVQAAVAVAVGVSSFNARTGAVTLQAADVSAAGGALVSSPVFTGNPQAPTPPPGDNDTSIATTAYVLAAIASGANVTSFNGRNGAVTLNASDISGAGGALLVSPSFTGTPTAPTPGPGDNSSRIATTAFLATALAASGVVSFNSRTGAVVLLLADVTGVGGAPLASPALTGAPTAPTAAPGTSTTQVATTAFVAAAITAGAVSSFNGRVGAVTLQASDVSAAGGAMVASPTFTGTPSAPTASPGTSSGQLATTAFVAAALAGGAGVVTFNTRAGAVVLLAADVTAAGGALLASPTFTGVPAGPTAAPGTNTTQLASTAFVTAAIASGTAHVVSFNSRQGAVTLSLADVTGAGGAPLASPTFTGTPAAPTATAGTSTTQLATTAFVAAAVNASVLSFNGRSGAVTLTLADVTGVGGAPLASPTFTGVPAVPTAAAHANSTQAASTAYVDSAIGAIPAASGATFAFWGGTVVITALGQNVTTNGNATGVITFASAHGLTTGQLVVIAATGSPPAALPAGQAFYVRALSTTTLGFYATLADAKADSSRIAPTGTATGWTVRAVTYSGVISRNFDPVCPIGAVTARGGIQPELNLSAPLPQTVNVMVFLERVNGLFDTEGTPAARNAWFSAVAPTIPNATLIRLDALWAITVVTTTGAFNPGNWTSQGQNNFYLGVSVIA